MPTYGYHCDSCGNEFDQKQSFHDEPKFECPKCGSIARRVFHAPPVIYKGSGFYTTDYARKGNANSGGSANNSMSSNSSSSESSSDSKSPDSSSSSDSSKSSSSSDSDSSSSSSTSGTKSSD